jgi:hypothetical protein
MYASQLRADRSMLVVFHSVLGKRLGKDMGKVANVVKKLSREQTLAF